MQSKSLLNDTSFGLYSPTSFLKDPLMQDISFSTNPSIPVSSTPIVAHASLPSQLATSTPAVTVSPAANMKAETREVVLYHRCTEPQLSLTCQCFNCAKQVGDCNQRFKERSTNDFKCDTLSSCKSLLHSLVSIYFFCFMYQIPRKFVSNGPQIILSHAAHMALEFLAP